MFYYMAASNDCHPNYVSYLMDKRTLSVQSINEILGKLEGEKKLLYDKNYIEQLYKEYQNIDVDDEKDIEALKRTFRGKGVLLIGPGQSIERQYETICTYKKNNIPITVSVNFVADSIGVDYIFLSNSKRYVQMATTLMGDNLDLEIIATSNVTKTNGKFDYTLKYSSLLDEEAEIIDNSFIMLLKIMKKLEVKHIALAGFDGYTGDTQSNYINPNMEYNFDNTQAEAINEYVAEILKQMKKDIDLEFITDSLYI